MLSFAWKDWERKASNFPPEVAFQLYSFHWANPTELPWGSTHWELWIRAQNFNNARFPKPQPTLRNSSSSSAAGPFVPKGFCRKFHRGDHCAGCNYKHVCCKCGVVHPALRCNFRSSQHNSSSAPTSAKSRPSNTSSN